MSTIKPASSYDAMFPSRFLKAGLFQEKPVTLTISEVFIEKMPKDDGTEKDRGILAFEKIPFQLTINSTNGQCLKAMFGNVPTKWVGKRVTFVSEKDRFGKEIVDSIRIKGSPDITDTIEIEIKMPKRKAKVRRLLNTTPAVGEKNTSDNYVPPEVNTETGEVKE